MQSLFIDLNNHLDPVNNERLYGFSKGSEIRKHFKLEQIFLAGNVRVVLKMPSNGAKVTQSFLRGLFLNIISSGVYRVRFDEVITIVGDPVQRQYVKDFVDVEFEMQSTYHKLRAWVQRLGLRFSNWVFQITDYKRN